MALAYLSSAEARERLIAAQIYTEESAPSADSLVFLLEDIEDDIDRWLGWRPALQDYNQRLFIDENGYCYLPNYPVVMVTRIKLFHPYVVNQVEREIKYSNLPAIWEGGNLLHFGRESTERTIQVEYRAGYDPLPRIFKRVAARLLTLIVGKSGLSGDTSFLDKERMQTTSMSIPGLSKSYSPIQQSKSSGGKRVEPEPILTERDAILQPLSVYRRRFTLESS